jgi:SAM-dependent methyltransferase
LQVYDRIVRARYDGLADWYDREFATGPLSLLPRETVLRLLGEGPGDLLDVGCGTGSHTAAFAQHGWNVKGLDISDDMLRIARARGLDVEHGDAASLPYDNSSFDAVVSMWLLADVEEFEKPAREMARVLRPGGALVYLSVHPCFVGPHSRFLAGEGVPQFFPGYRISGRYTAGAGISPHGLRARVGATHLTLAELLNAFLDVGLGLEHLVEPTEREYPHLIAFRCRK